MTSEPGAGPTRALSRREQLGYGVGDLGINFYFAPAITFLLYFYTDVFGIGAATAGLVFLVARVVDAATDPLMGAIADRTRTRWGKLRPYLLFGPVPMAVVAVLTFTTPAGGEGVRVAWAFATYIGFGITYTVISIPYSALTAAMTTDSHSRTVLSTIRMLFSSAGGLLVTVVTLPLVRLFADPRVGFQAVTVGYAVAATAFLWITFATTRERADAGDTAPQRFRDLLGVVRDNRPLWIVLCVFVLGMLAYTLRQSALVYYLRYNLGREDLLPLFFGLAAPIAFLGVLLTPWVARRLGKAGGVMAGGLVTVAGGLGVYAMPYDRIDWILGFYLLSTLGAMPLTVLGWSMLPDTVEYGEWKTGVRAEGTIFALSSFGQKLAMALGGAFAGALLSAVGYVPNAAQSETAQQGILVLVTLLPISMVALSLVAVRFYDLDEETHARIVSELRR